MLYMKDEEFVRQIRKEGYVVLQNETLADHYFQLLHSVFSDLLILKTKKAQYVYLASCKSKITTILMEKYRNLVADVMELDHTFKEMGGIKGIQTVGESLERRAAQL